AGGEAGTDLNFVSARHDPCRNGEATVAFCPAKFDIRASTQSMARAKQRHGLKQIGLARAVVAHEHHWARVKRKFGARIVPEIGELETADKQERPRRIARDRLNFALSLVMRPHTRIGMST